MFVKDCFGIPIVEKMTRSSEKGWVESGPSGPLRRGHY
jgi:hypothetical protein